MLASILGLHLFNIFLCGLLLFLRNIDVASYADDNTPYNVSKSTIEMLRDINATTKKGFQIKV